MTKHEFVLNVMENDQEGIETMTPGIANYILAWMRGDDENGEIPEDLTPEEFAEIWNSYTHKGGEQ